jgi:hypothetical protein
MANPSSSAALSGFQAYRAEVVVDAPFPRTITSCCLLQGSQLLLGLQDGTLLFLQRDAPGPWQVGAWCRCSPPPCDHVALRTRVLAAPQRLTSQLAGSMPC